MRYLIQFRETSPTDETQTKNIPERHKRTEDHGMNILKAGLTATVLLILCVTCRAFQATGGRESSPRGATSTDKSKKANRTPVESRKENRKIETPPSELSISVAPPDSTIILDGVGYHAENGAFIRVGLKPKLYKIVVHRDGYQDQGQEINLGPGHNPPLIISLKPLPGTLSVTPTVADADINLIESETNGNVGTYFGRARNIELPPGRYQVLVSKEGYQTTVREVLVKSAAIILLEPALDPLPKPSPAAVRRAEQPRFRPDTTMQVQTSVVGKFIVVSLIGRSGDMVNLLGTVDVVLGAGSQGRAGNVSGMLTGYPCQVDFVRLENVAEYSFVEPPGTANQWARAVVRVRPKDNKRPVHFVINWKSIRTVIKDESPTN